MFLEPYVKSLFELELEEKKSLIVVQRQIVYLSVNLEDVHMNNEGILNICLKK